MSGPMSQTNDHSQPAKRADIHKHPSGQSHSHAQPAQRVYGHLAKPPRFAVGIDLGTTNCALAFVDLARPDATPEIFPITQWETEGAYVTADMLPSFYYLPVKAEWRRGQMRLPLHRVEAPGFGVGRMARAKASQIPGRVIHSAKSWLCHPGVNREERILPWHSDEIIGDERRSPIEVSAAYLEHLREAWNAVMAAQNRENCLELQDVTITVPASFDEVAQRLTLEAAAAAGFNADRIRLLEEPQAAFYRWLSVNSGGKIHLGSQERTVLICDVGGGTTDFSLFHVEPGEPPKVRRVAVSEHLLLGGDNIDLSLAHKLEARLLGGDRRLSSRQWAQLVFETRQLKEKALADMGSQLPDGTAPDAEFFVSIAGEGANLFASTMTAALKRSEIENQILAGFVPDVAREAVPIRSNRGALQQLGLPYAQDSAITRHLASFLAGHPVDFVLYNGGTLKPSFLRDALTRQLTRWQKKAPEVLTNDSMDLAVALGAAAYGAISVRPKNSLARITGGYARSLYLEAARVGRTGSHSLICIVPKGFEAGQTLQLPDLNLKLLTDRPARFQLFSALGRDADRPGDIVDLSSGTFHPLPPLHTRLDFSGKSAEPKLIEVGLDVVLQETGILQIFVSHLDPQRRRWLLDFNVRQETNSEDAAQTLLVSSQQFASEKTERALARLESYFGKKKRPEFDRDNPKYLVRDLEQDLGFPREEWNIAFLRSLWPHLEPGINRRSRSLGHEISWLYLAGYALRPGYGFELDEWRISELWRVFEAGLAFPKERQVEEQWWIMWRRVAGGLSREQQEKLFDRIFPALRKGEAQSPELLMLAGSLERIEMGQKLRLGSHLAQQIAQGRRQFLGQRLWALARVASRTPLYAGPAQIVRPEAVIQWAKQLEKLSSKDPAHAKLALFYSQAGRLVGDREFDLPEPIRHEFLSRLKDLGATGEQARVLTEMLPLDIAAKSQLFGESLPVGLILG